MSQTYTLFYWGGVPGRGEFIRLAFEYTKTPYNEINDYNKFQSYLPPSGQHFAVPFLEIDGSFMLSQTSAILAYLAPKLGLAGSGVHEQAKISQLTLTALDLTNEAHDAHHPLSVNLTYEDQKEEALRRAPDFRKSRIPKFFTHFESVLSKNESGLLVGSRISTADLALFHVLEGLTFAFPHRIKTLKNSGSYEKLFAFQDRLRKELEQYLGSPRRLAFGMGIFRHYPELDEQESAQESV